jgi:hypothetical protein
MLAMHGTGVVSDEATVAIDVANVASVDTVTVEPRLIAVGLTDAAGMVG